VVDAALALIRSGSIPSSAEIAQRAGVTQRTLFNQFGDMETLVQAAAGQHTERVLELAPRVDPDLPLGDRIQQYADAQAFLLEETMHVRWAILSLPRPSKTLQDAVWLGRAFARHQLATIFGHELDGLDDERREEVLDELEMVIDPVVWRLRRFTQGRSLEDASARVERTLRALLEALVASSPTTSP
jgi:TetR/AcrR family transcriptional regulator, regulator of autoinduction and epiphytic fitness